MPGRQEPLKEGLRTGLFVSRLLFAQPHARTSTVLVDEFDPGGFYRIQNLFGAGALAKARSNLLTREVADRDHPLALPARGRPQPDYPGYLF
jgi:hypothetical protein